MRRLSVVLLCGALVGAFTAPAHAQDEAPSPPEITVLEEGSNPRAELRYQLVEGTTQDVIFSLNSSIGQRVNGQLFRGDTPQIELDITATVGPVEADGSTTLAYSYVDARIPHESVPETTRDQILDALAPIVGLSGTITLTPRGEATASTIDVPDDLDEAATQLVEGLVAQSRSLAVPLPEEPVGVGARWEAKTEAVAGGIEITQTATYELLELRDDEAVLDVEVEQRAPRQRFTPPGTDTELLLRSSRGSGSGEYTLVFANPFPPEGELHLQIRQKLRGGGDRISQTLTINLFLHAG
jgi:hypothetical protein